MKRRTQANKVLNRTLSLTILLLVFAGSLGFFTVWLRHQISVAANANKRLEVKIADLNRHIDEVNSEVAVELSPDNLLALNQRFHLGLVRPRESQVVRVQDDVEVRLALKRNRELFSDNTKLPRDLGIR